MLVLRIIRNVTEKFQKLPGVESLLSIQLDKILKSLEARKYLSEKPDFLS